VHTRQMFELLIVQTEWPKRKKSLKLSPSVCQAHGRHTPRIVCQPKVSKQNGTKEKKIMGNLFSQQILNSRGREWEWMAPKGSELVGKLPDVTRTWAQQTLKLWDSFPKRLPLKSPNGMGWDGMGWDGMGGGEGGHQISTASLA
jgi:hypothetical protein